MRSALVWIGAGLLLGSALWALATAFAIGEGLLEEVGGWWIAAVVIACFVLAFGIRWQEHPHVYVSDHSTVLYRCWMVLFCLAGLALLGLYSLADPFRFFGSVPLFDTLSPFVHLWLAMCAFALGAVFMLLSWRVPNPRPFGRSMTLLGAGALAVVVLGGAIVLVVPREQHRVADELGEPAPVPAEVSQVGWEWQPPQGASVVEVRVGSHGPLALLRDGVVSLDGETGEVLWSYLRPHDPVHDVWRDDGSVFVSYETRAAWGDSGQLVTVRLDERTGEVRGETAVALPDWPEEPFREPGAVKREALSLPEECVVSSWDVQSHDGFLLAPVGCLVDADTETLESVARSGSPFDWPDVEVDVMVVAVDRFEERELWHTEWPARSEEDFHFPRLSLVEGPPGEQQVLLKEGWREGVALLDLGTGEEVVALPDDLMAGDSSRTWVSYADPDGSVVAVDTTERGRWEEPQFTFHQVNAAGEIIDTAVVEGAHLENVVDTSGIAVLDGSLLIGWDGHVVDAPFGEVTQWSAESFLPVSDVSGAGLKVVPGAVVVSEGGKPGLTGMVP
ncbi:hypothetical protein NE857_12260 [Nocardiopsis exhalans]|uniref:Uncharacterized protein n=1 Tax=Nocardiopsis exhalans TaxID=163604 RepID=A0ABY5DDA6_9ACTN|nr:hypothetical protein [Nocardiopsis exhalans]USY22306.1 hypothetical protein NE857_12260 [Nocardiopsis exhalans]